MHSSTHPLRTPFQHSIEPMAAVTPNTLSTFAAWPVPRHAAQVLIAEDDIPLARFLENVLRNECYAVDLAHDGEAVLQAIALTHYDLLILDLGLPEGQGLALLRRVRPSAPSLPILVLTAQGRVEDRIV